MADNIVPHLGPMGWCDDDDTKLDILLSHFYTSDYSQSQIFDGTVSSLAKIMQTSLNNPAGCAAKIENTVQDYLAQYFTAVTVKCTVVDAEAADAVIQLEIGYSSKGKEKSALRALSPSGGIFQHVIRILNTGSDS